MVYMNRLKEVLTTEILQVSVKGLLVEDKDKE
jgi:hypothetical protein